MDTPKLPSDFDWVTARHACSVGGFFERLCVGARQNVNTRKALRVELADTGPIEFTSSRGIFSVMRTVNQMAPVGVRFVLDGQTIRVEGSGVDVGFKGTLTLTDEGECRLRVNGEELDEWQVLRRGLETLFFT
jgi:hypothetical protein